MSWVDVTKITPKECTDRAGNSTQIIHPPVSERPFAERLNDSSLRAPAHASIAPARARAPSRPMLLKERSTHTRVERFERIRAAMASAPASPILLLARSWWNEGVGKSDVRVEKSGKRQTVKYRHATVPPHNATEKPQ
jgi:hypothetical protein